MFRRILDNDVPQNGDQVARLEVKILKLDLIYESHALLPEMFAAKQSKPWRGDSSLSCTKFCIVHNSHNVVRWDATKKSSWIHGCGHHGSISVATVFCLQLHVNILFLKFAANHRAWLLLQKFSDTTEYKDGIQMFF